MQKPQKRSDAQMHRALLLDSADKVFSEHGVHVALELVTAHAGVSRATLYRNFPDRDALMGALLERSFEKLEEQAQLLQGRSDALFGVLERMAQLVAESAPVSDHWRTADRDSPVLANAQRRLTRLVKPLLQQAIASGTCRADLTAKDVTLVSSMIGSGLRGRTHTERRNLSRRALNLLLDGLRAPATTPSNISPVPSETAP